MPRPASSHPTEVELQILRILWERGSSPVRDIHARLEAEKGTLLDLPASPDPEGCVVNDRLIGFCKCRHQDRDTVRSGVAVHLSAQPPARNNNESPGSHFRSFSV